MKKYEALTLEIQELGNSDVITTSNEVTTEDVNVPWTQGSSAQDSYNID